MLTPKIKTLVVGGITALACIHAYAHEGYELGSPANDAQIAGWNIDVSPTGDNLPKGSGNVEEGRAVYASSCQACHGASGEGGIGNQLVGGQGTLDTDNPVKTVGSYWQYSTTLFDYIRRAMPLGAPHSLSSDDVYAVTAFLLYKNGIVDEEATMNATSLPKVKMPNADGFVSDPRPDVHDDRCMEDCGEVVSR